MQSKRYYISKLRNKLNEVNADSIRTNKFLYSILEGNAKWLIQREFTSNRLFQNRSLFQKISCVPTHKVSKVAEACPEFLRDEEVYATCELPEMWLSEFGPIMLHDKVSSVDNFSSFRILSSSRWENREKSPYKKLFKEKYGFYENNRIFFKEDPKRINLSGFFKDYVPDGDFCSCLPSKDCVRFLDTPFYIPDRIEEELLSQCFQQLVGTLQIPADTNINKNVNIKN